MYLKREEFYNKKSHLDINLQKKALRNGVAYIPCRVDGVSDIISKFSIEGFESLDGEFVDFLLDCIDCIPEEYPVVLEIHGPKFSEETKKRIIETIMLDGDSLLGKTEAQNRSHRKVFWLMLVGTIGSDMI